MSPGEVKVAGMALAKRTRKAQGLPRTVRDREAIRHVVSLLVARRKAA